MQKKNKENLIAKINIKIFVLISTQNYVARFKQHLFKIQ